MVVQNDGRPIPPISAPLKEYGCIEIKHRKNQDILIRIIYFRHDDKIVLSHAFEKPDHYETNREKKIILKEFEVAKIIRKYLLLIQNYMKNIIKNNRDVIAEARKNKKFPEYSENAALKLRLAVEIYNSRERLAVSQQELARKIGSTQKVISRIENGDVNIGIDILSRLAKTLNFDSDSFIRIFNCCASWILIDTISRKSQDNMGNKVFESNLTNKNYILNVNP